MATSLSLGHTVISEQFIHVFSFVAVFLYISGFVTEVRNSLDIAFDQIYANVAVDF